MLTLFLNVATQNKENLCFWSHSVKDFYFDTVEIFFLIVGHTHNSLDQWFSVLGKAIKSADFIGSVAALHELYKLAHKAEGGKDEQKAERVVQMTTFHDWRAYYDPVRNDSIHNYNIPHRFKISRDEQWGVPVMQYMVLSPPAGTTWAEKWMPPRKVTPVSASEIAADGDIPVTPFMMLNGRQEVLKHLGIEGADRIEDVAQSASSRTKLQQVFSCLPVVEEIANKSLATANLLAERRAQDFHVDLTNVLPLMERLELGEQPVSRLDKVDKSAYNISDEMLKIIDAEMIKGNKSEAANIIWLKMSQSPRALDGRPDVLPNPELWKAHQRGSSAPESQPLSRSKATLQVDHDVDADADADVEADADAEAEAEVELDPEAERISAKAFATKAKLAKRRELAFMKGAADMAKTARDMIAYVEDGRVGVNRVTDDIVVATRGFTKAVLTAKELKEYEKINSVSKIVEATKRQVCKLTQFITIQPSDHRSDYIYALLIG